MDEKEKQPPAEARKETYYHQKVMEAAYRPALASNATKLEKIWYWLTSPPTQKANYRLSAFTAAVAVAFIIAALFYAKILGPSPAPIYPGEIDISGVWQINYSDNEKFAQPKLDTKAWCKVGVPNPRLAEGQSQPKNCPKELYAVEKMRGKTYWYRKEIQIPENFKLENPALFFGAIKHKAEIFWDGQYIGATQLDETTIDRALLRQNQIKAGTHILALRVTSGQSKYPGIFHAYDRKMTLGENKNNQQAVMEKIISSNVISAVTLTVLGMVILTLISLLLKGQASGEKFYWLLAYFSSYSIVSILTVTNATFSQPLREISAMMGSLAILGWGLDFHVWLRSAKFAFRKIIISAMFLMAFVVVPIAIYFSIAPANFRIASNTLALFPLVLYGFSGAWNFLHRKKIAFIKSTDWPTIVSLLVMHLFSGAKFILPSDTPSLLSSPIFSTFLSLVVLYFAISQYTRQERELAFLGRFIRPGLRKLIEQQNFQTDSKQFRGRKIPILKIDIVNHTLTTFQMPFGIKRLFQDLWFTHIDQVTHDLVFLDKNVGDGSIYCFREDIAGGSCSAALKAAEKIRDQAAPAFDRDFKEKLAALLAITPELALPAQKFFKAYQERSGEDFFARSTAVRMGLVFGFVDEGMWGLSAQSHYDVQGDLVSLAARIEAKAEAGEIVVDTEFYKELGGEGKISIQSFAAREEELKGIGKALIYSASAKIKKAA